MSSHRIKHSVIAIGNFDGYHLGHRTVIEVVKKVALKEGLQSKIVTFSPNPKKFFNPELHLIYTDSQKQRVLENLDVNQVVLVDFQKIVHMNAKEFVEEILIKKHGMVYLVVGKNFRFGRNREGDVHFLKELSLSMNFSFQVVHPVEIDGIPISSTLIREKLNEAKVADAARMMGKLYYIDGTIVQGEHLGKQLGFPTINVKTDHTLLPQGVFKTRTKIDQTFFYSVTNIGKRPTFGGENIQVESHLLDFNKEVYGKNVRIFFIKKIRDEKTFHTSERLVEQIKADIREINIDNGSFF